MTSILSADLKHPSCAICPKCREKTGSMYVSHDFLRAYLKIACPFTQDVAPSSAAAAMVCPMALASFRMREH